MNSWFCSDLHFFHKNIINYCNRPFKSVDEMNKVIIRKHNERVKKEDTVYFLGDFGFFASKARAFRGEDQLFNPEDIISQMNGKQWYWVKGNHDKGSNKFKTKIKEIIINIAGIDIQLIHNPEQARTSYPLILCGHKHNSWKVKEITKRGKTSLIINCSVDVWDFFPVSWDQIQGLYMRWKKGVPINQLNTWKSKKEIINE